MDSLAHYRQIIQNILREHAKVPYAYGDVRIEPVFDTSGDHYLLMIHGWDNGRVHGSLVHVDLIDGKFWIQRDGTENGIARDLEEAGVPRDHIVLAFRSPELRKHSGYAVT
jgi:hypothetical protein